MRRRFLLTMLCLLAVLLLPVIPAGADDELDDAPAYYTYSLDSTETKLEREAYEPEQETAEYMIPALVDRLNDPKNPSSGHRLLTEDISIRSYEIDKDVVKIFFTEAYSALSRAREILVRAGTVRTFAQVPGIRAVTIWIENEELTDTRGMPIGEMNADTFASMSTIDMDAYRYDTFTLYFVNEAGNRLTQESRTVYYRRSIPKARVALEQLALGPMEEGNFPTIPEETDVLSVTTADNVCYADLGNSFVEERITELGDELPVRSVVNTLLAATEADKVQITIAGEGETVFGESLSLYQFFTWDDENIPKEEADE
ncbi:MAG: GerMN domain-containing protein [Blautia sp.]|nr:GerMN domain-containing protein [Blautia sp.]